MQERIPISVVVLTKNEQGRISKCLDSVKWADEIIVVDDESEDQTLDIVRQYTNRLFIRSYKVVNGYSCHSHGLESTSRA